LLIVVQSDDPAWAWALAGFVDRHRSAIIGVDDTINFRAPISPQSSMDAFYIASAVSGSGVTVPKSRVM
jgi:hypothetical protein